jgi:mono/diheme cytochrome c family protein
VRKLPLVVGTLALLLSRTAVFAAESENASKAMYVKYCGACHGPAGKGDGIAGTFFRPQPPDLTQLAKKNGGTFPLQRTMEFIDGRKSLRAHGDPDMPVWGELLSEEANDDLHRRAVVRGTISMITDYLVSIQEK